MECANDYSVIKHNRLKLSIKKGDAINSQSTGDPTLASGNEVEDSSSNTSNKAQEVCATTDDKPPQQCVGDCHDDGRRMIECSLNNCGRWMHIACAEISEDEANRYDTNNIPYYCMETCKEQAIAIPEIINDDSESDYESFDEEELKYKIEKRDTLIDQYLDQIESLKKDMVLQRNNFHRDLESKEAELVELKSEIVDLKKKNSVGLKQREAAGKRIQSLESAHSTQIETTDSLQSTITELESCQKSLQDQIVQLQTSKHELESELQKHKEINSSILADTIVTDTTTSVTSSNDETIKKCKELEEKLKKIQTENNKMKKEYDGLKTHCAAIEAKRAELDRDITQNMERITKLEGELKCERELSQQLRKTNNRLSNVELPVSDNLNQNPGLHGETSQNHAHPTNDVCDQEFQFPGSCTRSPCPFTHNFDKSKTGVCIIDFERKGECSRKDRCRYSHLTPQILRDDPVFRATIKRQKEQTFGICFYDYFQKGSCPRSAKKCRFSHNCSQERRDNPFIREAMMRKMKAKLKDLPANMITPDAGAPLLQQQQQTSPPQLNRPPFQGQYQPDQHANVVSPPATYAPRYHGPPTRPRPPPPTSIFPHPLMSKVISPPSSMPTKPLLSHVVEQNTSSNNEVLNQTPTQSQESSQPSLSSNQACALNIVNNPSFQTALQNIIVHQLLQMQTNPPMMSMC